MNGATVRRVTWITPKGKKLGEASKEDVKKLAELLKWRAGVYGRPADLFRSLVANGQEVK